MPLTDMVNVQVTALVRERKLDEWFVKCHGDLDIQA